MAVSKGRNPTCDAWRHKMVEIPDDRAFSELLVWKYQIVFQCERCPVRRYIGLDAFGEIGMSRYVYPSGWKRYRGDERPSNADFRKMYAEGRRSRRGRT